MRRSINLSRIYLKHVDVKSCRPITFTPTNCNTGLHSEWENPKETIFNTLVGHQKRAYAPAVQPTSAQECWNCKKDAEDTMMCKECGHLQDVNADVNYFKLLNFPLTYDLDTSALTQRFRQLQTVVHPDKFSNKSTREQSNSADWSSFINKAYKTLLIPIDRAEYLIKLGGREIPQDNSALDKEFLMEMMERNESIQEANTKQELEEVNESLKQELHEKVSCLNKKFEENDINAAISVIVEMKYLLSIQKRIKDKLQSLMGTLTY